MSSAGKRLISSGVGVLAGAVVGLLFALLAFVLIAGLAAGATHGSGLIRSAFLYCLIGIGGPCVVAGALVFAVPATGFGSLLIRMSASTLLGVAFGRYWFDDPEVGMIVAAVVVSVPLWTLCLLSLAVGVPFFRRR